jgi:hypothetical protein
MSDCLTELLTFVNSKWPKVNPSNTINVEVTLNSVTRANFPNSFRTSFEGNSDCKLILSWHSLEPKRLA